MVFKKIILILLVSLISSGCANNDPKVQGNLYMEEKEKKIEDILEKKAKMLAKSNIDFIIIKGYGLYCIKGDIDKELQNKSNGSLKVESNYKNNLNTYNVVASKLPIGTEIYYLKNDKNYYTYINSEFINYNCKKVLVE